MGVAKKFFLILSRDPELVEGERVEGRTLFAIAPGDHRAGISPCASAFATSAAYAANRRSAIARRAPAIKSA